KSADIASAFDEFKRNFEIYKEQNEQRIAEIAGRGPDPLTEEKMLKLGTTLDANKRTLDELVLKSSRPTLAGETKTLSAIEVEHRKAFDAYIRHGEVNELKRLEAKALSAGSGADGGFLVPEETEHEITRRLAQVSAIRAIAGNRQVSTTVYRKPFQITGAASGWVGETAARPQTDSPAFAELAFPTMELYAMPAATQTLLDDAAVNIDEWIAGEIDTVFAEQEGTAFVTGDGTNKPKGFLAYTAVAESAWQWGELGYIATGAAGAFAASDPADALVDLVYALKSGYRQNGSFVMNRRTQAEVRKLKDDSGNYLWSPGLAAGQPATLLGYPVMTDDSMPDIGANSLAITFGDFRRGYLVVDRMGVRVLRDPYSAKPYILFYVTKRVGGGVADFDAIKLLKFAAS
ncbi:MAG: phage major capsid protein, partial [Xanthobacteraceae bacterium]